ncbi:biotin--[acetyl-CoA-carboxylase] ligase [Mycolicibacterium fortuitum]|uniref:biotin--[biotin carboxyl-carrier protein] ligase n=1 Tax=Mycolicibacterium fortuitum TaxID=1766 RepID=A0ABD6QPW2_MYCFO|nr:biotin--[acetyl-CoA-carboxylase] ligase [Mycolicibacterium fortuitum]OBA94286.1 biotin--[acetyl-CoA-carboxylase] ligase [Mycolicibacterium fortuitum]OBJ92261.1 biotin--[acetyl-CoA-carboxylase] ligase [Mycolicibacterium fortuitum]OMC48120.1 biotin--[acetyl-CoA-carboxylase] ligase [Mycolicibacterium fortuitum]
MNTRPALDVTTLRDGLEGLAWRRVDIVEDTGSTNADLLARAAAGEDIVGAVLFAEHQNAGRGRHGRHWSAPPRSQVIVSFGVDGSAVSPNRWGWLPLATGLAIVDAVAEVTGTRVGLKWPNDVLVGPGGGKLAGILAEVASPAPVIVVGLGLNVTMTAEEAPDPRATSLTQLGAATVDRAPLARALLRQLDARITAWHRDDPSLAADYRARSVTIGSRVRAILPGDNTLLGVAADVDELGRLVIDTGTERVTVSAGDITHLRPEES